MYVNPFWGGVFATVILEIAACFVYAIIETNKRGRK